MASRVSCGTPAIATAVGGMPEVLADVPQAGELLRERSAAAIAEAVQRWLARDVDRAVVRRTAQAYAWDTSAAQLATLMQAVAAGETCHA